MTPTDIMEKVMDEAKSMSRPAYRGQANVDWKLLSGAVHRLQKAYGDSVLDDENGLRKLVSDYHRDIISSMEVIDGERISELQRLSVLQHQGAATGLLDFTESALVALWFACEGAPDKDGKVFILDIGNHQIAANGRMLTDEALFGTGQVVYYEPDRSLGARIVAQQSVFLICNPPQIPDGHVNSVVVPKTVKDDMKEYMESGGVQVMNMHLLVDSPQSVLVVNGHRKFQGFRSASCRERSDRSGPDRKPGGPHDTVPPALRGSRRLRPAAGWIVLESSAWRRIR